MSRLIDADAIPYNYTNERGVPMTREIDIQNMPTIEERKTGKWLPCNNNYYEERFICSVCGRSYKVDTCMGKPMWDFCPCGAKMEGVES